MPDPSAPTLEQLHAVAGVHGVGTDFWGFYGELTPVSGQTLTAILTALGVDVSSAEACEQAVRDRADHPWRQMVPPTVVMREGTPTSFPVHVPDGDPVDVTIVDEWGQSWPAYLGQQWTDPRVVDGVRLGRATFWAPTELPLGWHTIRATSPGREAEATLVVVPHRVTTADSLAARTPRGRTWGLMAQLYSVRSRRSWGVGDIEDLADLTAIAGEAGADWVLVNPLHAAEPVPPLEDSPYLPATRRFFNPIYIRVESIPEASYLSTAARARVEQLAELASADNGDPTAIRRDPAYAAKLEALHLVYAVPRSPGRERRFAGFKDAEGEGLRDFALWCALRERYPADDPVWSSLAPGSDEASVLAQGVADRVDFFCWLQWVLDEQLEEAQSTAMKSGMTVGVVHDLAVGVHPCGADAWALRDALIQGASVGAPPDMYNQQGQNWSQPPWHPGRLADLGYAPFRDMLRTILRHAGGIRVDHVLGLFRLWWVPEGMSAAQGAYVYYDHDALVGILCLEAQRAGAVVIGEDLGTFEPWVRDFLASRGLLGTSILWFEYEDGAPMPPEHYRTACLASVNTHDLPPTAGYLAGAHVDLRAELGLLSRPVEVEREADRVEQERILSMCRERNLLAPEGEATEVAKVESLYRLLAAAPSLMQGVALVDAVGETRVQNQPGTDEEYPNWRIPLADNDGRAVFVEDLAEHPRVKSLFKAVHESLG